jgi:hypothetical protein
MGSFEWMEIETLSSEITALEARLEAAKSRHNYGLVKVVKEQITAAHQRRARYLAHISTSVAESFDPSPPLETSTEAQPRQEEIAEPDQPGAEFADPDTPDVQEELAEPDRPGAEPGDPIAPSGVAPADAGAIDGSAESWVRLTPTHIERAKHELDFRRAEMLAKHAEELKVLDVDQSEIDTLAQAIDAFVEKFNLPAAPSSVVLLGDERDRLQATADGG